MKAPEGHLPAKVSQGTKAKSHLEPNWNQPKSDGGWTLFLTKLGWFGLGWNQQGVLRTYLPESSKLTLSEKMALELGPRLSSEIPPWIAKLQAQICNHLDGQIQDFSWVPIALGEVGKSRPSSRSRDRRAANQRQPRQSQNSTSRQRHFRHLVYEQARKISAGETLSYGELAAKMQYPGAARAVGTALGKNPIPLIVPCHRILAAHHRIGGFSAPGGVKTKQMLLALEGVQINPR